MSWGRLDDGFHAHPKRELVTVAPDGLLSRAISYCAAAETDGFVTESWVHKQLHLPGHWLKWISERRWRKLVIDDAVNARLLERLPAGSSVTVEAPKKKGIREKARTVTVGPFDVDGYLVHDFLHCNPARGDLEERRAKDRGKKRGRGDRPRLWNGSYADDVSPGDSPGGTGVGTSSAPSSNENGDRQPSHASALERDVAQVFAEAGFPLGEIEVHNAVARFPSRDHVAAAHGCVAYLRAHPDKPVGLTFHRFLEREKPREAGRSKAQREADDLAALERLAERQAP